jgi:transcriptional regulator with XRE-family HTH domain
MSTTSRPIASDMPDGTRGITLSDLVAAHEDEYYAIEPAADAEMLRHLMEAKGVTQAQLLKDFTIPKSTISEILAGKKAFSRHVTAYGADTNDSAAARTGAADGGVARAVWAPPRPTFDVAADLPEQDEYEVRVYDIQRHRRLVAAVEIISPAN